MGRHPRRGAQALSDHATSTIAAIATAMAPAAIGVLRVTGPEAATIVRPVVGSLPPPRQAALRTLRDAAGNCVDHGLVLWFPGPGSYTGEDMVELHTHGSPLVMTRLLEALYAGGAEPARPGEFTERAFLSGKLDLLQAEAVSDLITANTDAALRAANVAITGGFSQPVEEIRAALIEVRSLLEAGIDFADEASVDGAHDHARLVARTAKIASAIVTLLKQAERGALLARGMRVVLCGPPNAGKSTLLNALTGTARAIVSPIPGTTRDVLDAEIALDGMLITLSDTAGLRGEADEIEREGMRRALASAAEADLLIFLAEADSPQSARALGLPDRIPCVKVRTKIDLTGDPPTLSREPDGTPVVALSARSGLGVDLLRTAIRDALQGGVAETDTPMIARTRHLEALRRAASLVDFPTAAHFAADVVETAERLRLAHRALGELIGDFTSEDLLGEIFSRFCIGK